MGHYSNKCPEKEESEKKKENAMVAASWGESDSDEQPDRHEPQKRTRLAHFH